MTTLVPRFGSNRMNAELPGKLLGPCRWIGVPFAGGLCEVPHLQATAVVCNDLDRSVINLAAVVKRERAKLVAMIDELPFHPDTLKEAQRVCHNWQRFGGDVEPDIFAACAYFVSMWMGRNDSAGTDKELDASLSVRWNGNGGDSNKRFRNASASLAEWEKVMRSCTFTCKDALEFIDNVKDREADRLGLYVDCPWPDDGAAYKHKFDEKQQRLLAMEISRFGYTRVVVRFGEHPLVRELYPETSWKWHPVSSRTQANSVKSEWLLTNF